MTETSTFFIQFLQTFLIFLTVFTFLTFFNFFSGTIFYIYGFKCHFEASRGNSGHSCCKTAAALTIPINECNDLIGQWKDKLLNKKVGYRKQIARQHSCHEKFWPGQGASSTLKEDFLIYLDHHAKFGHSFTYVRTRGRSRIFPPFPLGSGRVWPLRPRPSPRV